MPKSSRRATAQCHLASQSASMLCHSLPQGMVSGSLNNLLAQKGLPAAVERTPIQTLTGLI